MGCACGSRSGKSAAGAVSGYKVTTAAGQVKGPFLTQTEARMALTAAGGGTIEAIRAPA